MRHAAFREKCRVRHGYTAENITLSLANGIPNLNAPGPGRPQMHEIDTNSSHKITYTTG